MTNSLVERLRAKDAGSTTADAKLMAEAADELERLQRELTYARKAVDDLARHHLKAHNVATAEPIRNPYRPENTADV